MTLRERKRRARYILNNSVAAGETTQEALCLDCLMCNEPLQAHHRNYREGFELDVEWKCRECHLATDKAMREETAEAIGLCLEHQEPKEPFKWE